MDQIESSEKFLRHCHDVLKQLSDETDHKFQLDFDPGVIIQYLADKKLIFQLDGGGRHALTPAGEETLRNGYFLARAEEIKKTKKFQDAAIDTVELKRKYYVTSISVAFIALFVSILAYVQACGH